MIPRKSNAMSRRIWQNYWIFDSKKQVKFVRNYPNIIIVQRIGRDFLDVIICYMKTARIEIINHKNTKLKFWINTFHLDFLKPA